MYYLDFCDVYYKVQPSGDNKEHIDLIVRFFVTSIIGCHPQGKTKNISMLQFDFLWRLLAEAIIERHRR